MLFFVTEENQVTCGSRVLSPGLLTGYHYASSFPSGACGMKDFQAFVAALEATSVSVCVIVEHWPVPSRIRVSADRAWRSLFSRRWNRSWCRLAVDSAWISLDTRSCVGLRSFHIISHISQLKSTRGLFGRFSWTLFQRATCDSREECRYIGLL